jgi:hypothetical protein
VSIAAQEIDERYANCPIPGVCPGCKSCQADYDEITETARRFEGFSCHNSLIYGDNEDAVRKARHCWQYKERGF